MEIVAAAGLSYDDRVSDASDMELVRRARDQDSGEAFDELVARHQRWIQGVCARLLRSDDRGRDAAQEVFARALERLSTLRGENFPGWLKVIALNHCLNVIDREKRWRPLDEAAETRAPEPAADLQLLQAERLTLARRLIARLPEKQKIVFCLKYVDGCSYGDIARLTGFTDHEVKSFLQNARRNFDNWCRAEGEASAWRKTT
jgi:RNA polymerase sigma-70 factor (ECF subfamily)